MWPDMAKVIVERSRIGSSMRGDSKGYQRSLERLRLEEMPYREGMKRRHPENPRYNGVDDLQMSASVVS
jgi:hypothetical protein